MTFLLLLRTDARRLACGRFFEEADHVGAAVLARSGRDEVTV
jgi:hypothetical protein